MNERVKHMAIAAGFDVAAVDQAFNGHILSNSLERFFKLVVVECGYFTDPITRELMFNHFGVNNDA